MDKIKAKIRAFGHVYDGVVVSIKRKKVDIEWISGTGKKRITRATPVATEAELLGDGGIAKCWIEMPVITKATTKMVTDPDAVPMRMVAQQREYPEGSAHARRRALMLAEAHKREALKDCEACNALRAEASTLLDEAMTLAKECIEEADTDKGFAKVHRIVYVTKEEPDGA